MGSRSTEGTSISKEGVGCVILIDKVEPIVIRRAPSDTPSPPLNGSNRSLSSCQAPLPRNYVCTLHLNMCVSWKRTSSSVARLAASANSPTKTAPAILLFSLGSSVRRPVASALLAHGCALQRPHDVFFESRAVERATRSVRRGRHRSCSRSFSRSCRRARPEGQSANVIANAARETRTLRRSHRGGIVGSLEFEADL